MVKISIPEDYRKGFADLINLGDDKRSNLFQVLSEIEVGLQPSEIAAELCQKLGLDKETADGIIRTLFSLLTGKDDAPIELEQFVKGVVAASRSLENIELKDSEIFEKQMHEFLSKPSAFSLTNKAIDLITEREKIWLSSRVITDVRPIFGDGDELKFEASLIIHNLKVQFKENKRIKEFFFALDSEDLTNLKEQIIRAEEKENILKSILNEKAVKIVDFKN
ncbi:MAG: hypothetical protein EPO28_07820 [Saprospiraceae bacterium]|nr:MAG: hypothetical protein EPO28_07820 [Saprospiraceae bacterium]